MPTQKITADVCAQMVESATRSCQPMISVPPEQANPNWDAIAVSLTSQANSIAFGSAVIALVVALAGFAWGKIVVASAEREAREAAETAAKEVAKDTANAYISQWLAEKAPGIIRERVDLILDATLGSEPDAKAADDLGEQAG